MKKMRGFSYVSQCLQFETSCETPWHCDDFLFVRKAWNFLSKDCEAGRYKPLVDVMAIEGVKSALTGQAGK